MISLSVISRKIQSLVSLIENPKLIPLRKYGVGAGEYIFMSQPWFRAFKIKTILDVGANQGQFALVVNAVFPEAQVYSFEPVPSCFEALKRNTERIKSFKAFNLGLGDSTDELEFELNDFSASSSFLKMADSHKEIFPYTSQAKSIKVKVDRLDNLQSHLEIEHPLLVKIDVQGYEDRVLEGGREVIQAAKVVIIETSFCSLYQDQALFDRIYQQLTELGFSYKGMLGQMQNPHSGEVLQSDSIFVRTS
jgi:FkbM family methyltransferase